MRFTAAVALFAVASAVSVEQNNSINDTTYGLATGNSLKYLQNSRGATRNTYRTSTFRNRFSDRKAARNDAGSSLFDRQSNVMVFNGGCHFKPSKTVVEDYATAAAASLAPAVNMEVARMSGVFAMECISTQTNTAPVSDPNNPTTYVATPPTCTWVARADNFFFDRANTNTATDFLNLNVFAVSDQSTNIGLTTTPDEQLFNLGDTLVDNTANDAGLTYSNDGSCRLPALEVVAAGAAPGATPQVATGAWRWADSNRLTAAAGFTGATMIAQDHYSDSHFLSYRSDITLMNGATISFEQLSMISVAIQASAPASNVQTPLGCCKVEKWGARTYQRYQQKIARYNDRICDTTTYGQYNGLIMVPRLSTAAATGACVDAAPGLIGPVNELP